MHPEDASSGRLPRPRAAQIKQIKPGSKLLGYFYLSLRDKLSTLSEKRGQSLNLPSEFAKTPQPPYYAVIFTSRRNEDDNGYAAMSRRMMELAAQQPGFLGVESVRDAVGLGITVSYWESEQAIRNWKKNAEHQIAQRSGQKTWYQNYMVRVAKVDRAYGK
jgi:heme-degrading monooxygenase HmoA